MSPRFINDADYLNMALISRELTADKRALIQFLLTRRELYLHSIPGVPA